MKRWELSATLRDNPGLADQVDQLRPLLESVLGRSAPLVAARWSTGPVVGDQPNVVLNLSDWTCDDGVEESFATDELTASAGTRWKFHRLWGDLLQERNHRQLADLLKAE